MKEKHLAETLSKVPVVKRFLGITNPYSQYAQPIEQAKEKGTVDRWIENRNLDTLVDGYLYKDNVKRSEVMKYINTFKDPDTQDRLMNRFEGQMELKNLPNKSFWLSLKSIPEVEQRAKVYVDRYNRSNDEEKFQLRKELGIVDSAGGIVSDKFMGEAARLMRGR
jgi:hypothetical protein